MIKGDNFEAVLNELCGEMINVETGYKIYEKGVLINTEKCAPYFNYCKNGVITIPIYNRGFVILSSMGDWYEIIINRLNSMFYIEDVAKYANKYKKIYSAESGLTSLKQKTPATREKTQIITPRNASNTHLRNAKNFDRSLRFNYNNTRGSYICKFTWDIYSIQHDSIHILLDIYETPTIIVDLTNIFKTTFGPNHDISPQDFTCIPKLKYYSEKGESCRFVNKRWVNKKDNKINPGYPLSYSLTYGFSQIIQCLFGNVHDDGITMFNITKDIYYVEFDNITIDNSPNPNDACNRCKTPLYGDIYLLFTDSDKIATAECPICTHIRYTSIEFTDPMRYYRSNRNNRGFAPYEMAKYLARTKYPKTLDNILEPLDLSKNFKDIISCEHVQQQVISNVKYLLLETNLNKKYKSIYNIMDYIYKNHNKTVDNNRDILFMTSYK